MTPQEREHIASKFDTLAYMMNGKSYVVDGMAWIPREFRNVAKRVREYGISMPSDGYVYRMMQRGNHIYHQIKTGKHDAL